VPDPADIPSWKRRHGRPDYLSHSEISRRAYYIYPDGELAVETFRVIRQAMAHSNKVGLGSVRIPCRERPVLVEPRGVGLVMSALHSAAKSARPSSAPRRRVKLTLKWLLSPRRSLNADRVRSSRRASETAIRTHCASRGEDKWAGDNASCDL
jgi:hypothetical protein